MFVRKLPLVLLLLVTVRQETLFVNGAFTPYLGIVRHCRPPPNFVRSTTTTTTSLRSIAEPPLEDATSATSTVTPKYRGKVNEIDFCMAPSDVSLSRSYSTSAAAVAAAAAARAAAASSSATSSSSSSTRESVSADIDTTPTTTEEEEQNSPGLSLTRALNSASNRVVRRILLARSWPSAEALNLSLRQVLASKNKNNNNKEGKEESTTGTTTDATTTTTATSTAKCPVPRPILNIIMRRRNETGSSIAVSDSGVFSQPPSAGAAAATGGGDKMNISTPPPMPRSSSSSSKSSKRGRTDEEYVADQIMAFRSSYGTLPGYDLAEAYLECILSLATSGVESPRVSEVLSAGVYDESYKRLIRVLKSVGTVFEDIPDSDPPRTRIAPKLVDQDICFSIMDKIAINNERARGGKRKHEKNTAENVTSEVGAGAGAGAGAAAAIPPESPEPLVETETTKETDIAAAEAIAGTTTEETKGQPTNENETSEKDEKEDKKFRLRFWKKDDKEDEDDDTLNANENFSVNVTDPTLEESAETTVDDENEIDKDDLGGVLLSAEEPTMTRQLNVLSNIVQRALLFGGDQELLVLYETLDADKPAFIQRWYPGTGGGLEDEHLKEEERPGVQYLNCLVQLLKDCYTKGGVTDLEPPLPLSQSYANAFERLMASLVELGSGYVKPVSLKKMPLPKNAQEEFGRFAQWEASVRKSSPDVTAYPDDLVGSWQVIDEIGGKTIGVSTVVFRPQGEVEVALPMRGLRWRLDPGPTHLDTCTFQVLSDDGAILQYKGYIDRGARLEARFSKRPIKIRGAVMFQMRDGEAALMGDDYRRDMLPINYKMGTTRFVMTKSSEGSKE